MRASWAPLLTAAALCGAALVPATALAAHATSAWSDLWHTPDQQGQALLDAGEPAQAAARFHDPRRRAYAELEAGRYPQAAKLLAPFTDADSEYNRGNALARSGQLQAALTAYDAALKQAPADKDIRHNRDLVERALRHERKSARSSSGHGKPGSQGAGPAGRQQQQQSAGGGGQAGSHGSQSGAHRAGGSNPQQAGGGGIARGSGGQQAAGAQSGRSRETPGQAQRDAAEAAALARRQRLPGGSGITGQPAGAQRNGPRAQQGSDSGDLVAGGVRTPRQKPETEQQLALDQWLRQIPDSPAGLLRRKFLIEHMVKQQEGGDSQESGQ